MTAKKDPDEATGGDGAKKGGKLKLILIIVPVLLLVVGAAVYFLVLKPSSNTTAAPAAGTEGEASTPTSTWVAGKIVTIDPITINLANGHYLQLGLALQATADAGEEVTPAKALDAAITQFSNNTVDELATQEGREAAKKELTKAIKEAYEKKVYEVYYTTFVMN
jgi:flagellar protein FliL